MKRIVIYIALLGASLLLPLKGEDVGKLLPVELVQLYKDGNTVIIATDTGDFGRGETVEAALENLKTTTAGLIFLDTADYLLISEDGMSEAAELKGYLKPTVRICRTEEKIDLLEAAEYLSIHKPTTRIKAYKGGELPEKLVKEDGRLRLKEK